MNGWQLAPKVVLAQAIQARGFPDTCSTQRGQNQAQYGCDTASNQTLCTATTAPQQPSAQRRVKGRTRTLIHMEIAIKFCFFKTLIVRAYKDDRHYK